jgi:integrase
MPRSRHQDGWVEPVGKRVKRWRGHYYVRDENDRRVHKTVNLGERAKLKKWEAEDKLRRHIQRITGQVDDGGVDPSFAWFWEFRFLPIQKWAPATRAAVESVFRQRVLPAIGKKPLSALNKFELQTFIDGLAAKWSKSVVQKARTYTVAALEEAVEQGYLTRNPARKTALPETRATCRRYLELAEISSLLDAMPPRDRLITRICLLCGLRPGELFAARWDDFDAERGRLRIDESASDWGIRSPKTLKSNAWVWLPASLVRELEAWRETAAAGLIFPSATGTPMRTKNFLRRHVWPAAIACGLMQVKPEKWPKGKPWIDRATSINFRAFRRTCATWFQQCGTPKDIQSHLRHATPVTTMGVYVQEIPESVRTAVEALDAKLTVLREVPERTM